MNILTDEEIDDVEKSFEHGWHHIEFARAIEAAVLSKLAEQAGEPVAWWVPEAEQFAIMDKPGSRPFAKAFEPLYTETQLIAAQQRTAEACVKVCESAADKYQETESRLWPECRTDAQFGASSCEIAIRNGEWREYM